MSISSIATLSTAPISKITSIVTVWQTTQRVQKLLAAEANSAPFCGVSFFPPAMITVLFLSRVAKSPTNYVLSKLHITGEFASWLMYIKTSRVSESVRVQMAVPLHLAPVLALIHAFPLFFWAPFAFYCTFRIGTDCCIMCALMFFYYYSGRTKPLIKVCFLSGKISQ